MADITGQLQAAAGAGGEETDENFNQTVLLLHGDGTNGAQNNTFLDSSTNNFTITRAGNTTQGTFSPFSAPDGRWSNYFDGVNDRLTIADNVALRPGTGNFTVEAWVYRSVANAAHTIFAKGGASTGFVLGITSGNVLRFTHTTTNIDSTGTVAANDWVHVAVVREGTGTNQVKLYINGVQDGQGTVSTDFNQTEEARIGENRGATDDFNGYISNFRYVVGSAIYTTAFTPSTSPLTTISQGAVSSEVELLTCQSNRFVDNSTNGFTVTPVNNVKVTPFSPFAPTAAYDASVNGGSGYFDGTGDYLSGIGVASDWTFLHNGSDWTIEFDVYHSLTSNMMVLNTTSTTPEIGASVSLNTTLANTVYVQFVRGVSGSSASFVSNAVLKINQWNHVAITFENSGKTCTFYINGVQEGSSSNTGFAYSASAPTRTLVIGAPANALTVALLNGYLANTRISNNIRTGLTSVPTAPYTSDANTELLCNFTNAGIFDNTGKNNLETVGNAQIDTTTKKYGTGSMEFDGTNDYLLMPLNGTEIRGNEDFTVEAWIYPTTNPTYRAIVTFSYDTNGTMFFGTSSGNLAVFVSGASVITAGAISLNTWTHVAVTRESNVYNLWLNGTSTGTATNTTAFAPTSPIAIGAGYAGAYDFAGFIDDVRITKGVARYTTTFTPPTKAFPDL